MIPLGLSPLPLIVFMLLVLLLRIHLLSPLPSFSSPLLISPLLSSPLLSSHLIRYRNWTVYNNHLQNNERGIWLFMSWMYNIVIDGNYLENNEGTNRREERGEKRGEKRERRKKVRRDRRISKYLIRFTGIYVALYTTHTSVSSTPIIFTWTYGNLYLSYLQTLYIYIQSRAANHKQSGYTGRKHSKRCIYLHRPLHAHGYLLRCCYYGR